MPLSLNVEYRPIPGVTGYEAGSDGSIRSVDRLVVKRDGKGGVYRTRMASRTLKPWLAAGRYLYVELGQRGPKTSVHRLVCLAFHGLPPDGTEVAHIDGNSLNNAASNLAWVTHSENVKHQQLHGTAPDYRTLRWGRPCVAA